MENTAVREMTKKELHPLYQKHQAALDQAIKAIHERKFYAHYPENIKAYPETGTTEGLQKYNDQLNNTFSDLVQESDSTLQTEEESPFTEKKLNISYPVQSDINKYIQNAKQASGKWKKTDAKTRAGILFESLEKIKERFFEIGYATMHTTGQAYVMSFQASGPHANDRALEAIALGLHEQTRFPEEVKWEKPMGKFNVELQKTYLNVPKGIALCIGCSTFPIWNTVPAIYADLVTGNPVIVKPHPKVIYPIAIVVAEIQKTLKENGFDPNLIQLACDTGANPITKKLAENPEIKIIDFTGSSSFGDYIESLPGKVTFTEKAGVNSVIFDSCKDLNAAMQNLAFSVSLYSGQMCTCPQNFFIPKSGITVDGNPVSYEEVVSALAESIKGLVNNEKMGPGTLGAIQSKDTFDRVNQVSQSSKKVILPSQKVSNPEFPDARIATPAILEVSAEEKDTFEKETFGPVIYVIPTKNTEESVKLAKEIAAKKGAISCAAYCTDPKTQDYIAEEMAEAYTGVSFNFTGPIWVNQSAGFSDFHVSGGNPAGNASLTDPEFITRRFEIVGIRKNLA